MRLYQSDEPPSWCWGFGFIFIFIFIFIADDEDDDEGAGWCGEKSDGLNGFTRFGFETAATAALKSFLKELAAATAAAALNSFLNVFAAATAAEIAAACDAIDGDIRFSNFLVSGLNMGCLNLQWVRKLSLLV